MSRVSEAAAAKLRAVPGGGVTAEGEALLARPIDAAAAAGIVGAAAAHGVPLCLRGRPAPGAVLLDRGALERVGPVDEPSLWIEAEAGAKVSAVEATLRGRGLTLGPLPPSVFQGDVAAWLEGPHAGRRAEDGRIGSSVAALVAALANGALYRGKAAPRSAAGPGLQHLLLGAGGVTGAILGATLRAQALPPRLERAATRGAPAAAAAWLHELSATIRPPIDGTVIVEEGALVLALSFAGDRHEAVRRKDRALSRAAALGLPMVEPPGEERRDPLLELEVPREALAAALTALPRGTRAQLVRIARESLVLCGGPGLEAAAGVEGVRLLAGPDGPGEAAPDDPALAELLLRIAIAVGRQPC